MVGNHDLLAVKTEPGTISIINKSEIIFLRAAGNYVDVFFNEGRLLHRSTLQAILKRMPSQFVQIHRSYIVNLHYLKRVQSELGRYTECVMSDGQQLPIGAQYKAAFMSKLGLATDEKHCL